MKIKFHNLGFQFIDQQQQQINKNHLNVFNVIFGGNFSKNSMIYVTHTFSLITII